ncbi:MAG: transketolase [Candidatus Asgardarchaeia archaeon]
MLEDKCKWLRNEILDILYRSKKGHVGGALSCVEILVALYYGGILEEDDKFILSKGHVSMAFYPILHDLGYINDKDYEECYLNGNPLGGHPDINIKGVEFDTGSLGHGLGVACGMALARINDEEKGDIYVLMGDGECNEGSVWESILFAAQHSLNNIILIIDKNNICATDFMKDSCSLQYLGGRLRQCGWAVCNINGHDVKQIIEYIKKGKKVNPYQPLVIIANTVKGKGISYMENVPKWHHGVPNDEQLEIARREINGP